MCPLTTRHTAKTQCGQLRERVSYALARAETTLTELRRERAPEAKPDKSRPRQDAAGTAAGTIVSVLRLITWLGGRSGNTSIQSGRVHDRGKPSRAKPDERCRTPFAYRPSRHRLQRRDSSCDAQKWTTRGTAESTTMPTTRWPSEL